MTNRLQGLSREFVQFLTNCCIHLDGLEGKDSTDFHGSSGVSSENPEDGGKEKKTDEKIAQYYFDKWPY